MANIKVLKIASDGVPLEHTAATDDITFNSFTAGSGPVMSPTGIDMNGQDVTDISDLVFTDPSVGTINQTAGALIANNIMAKERNNVMTVAGAVLFPLVTDTAGQVDSFKVPHIAGVPTATPAFSSDAGYMVYDDTNDRLYLWDGAAWQDQTTVSSTGQVANSYIADEALTSNDAVYISAADNVSKALADNASATSRLIGFAKSTVADTAVVSVASEGLLSGFSGLTAGSRYYLSAASAGLITATIPTGSGNSIVQAGYAKSATVLHIHIEQMGRRA